MEDIANSYPMKLNKRESREMIYKVTKHDLWKIGNGNRKCPHTKFFIGLLLTSEKDQEARWVEHIPCKCSTFLHQNFFQLFQHS